MLKLCAFLLLGGLAHANKLSLTPPMGWMSWEVFRCRTDCSGTNAGYCVDETTYKAQADALVSGGFLAAGYKTVSIDDCWEQKSPERDAQGRLAPDPKRFPSGFKALADYMHKQNVSFGIYSDMGTHTCGGYPGTEGHEEIDAKTFAEWGVDYLKLDGCNVVAPVTSLSLPPSLSLPLSLSLTLTVCPWARANLPRVMQSGIPRWVTRCKPPVATWCTLAPGRPTWDRTSPPSRSTR